jgi:hypothetical protein
MTISGFPPSVPGVVAKVSVGAAVLAMVGVVTATVLVVTISLPVLWPILIGCAGLAFVGMVVFLIAQRVGDRIGDGEENKISFYILSLFTHKILPIPKPFPPNIPTFSDTYCANQGQSWENNFREATNSLLNHENQHAGEQVDGANCIHREEPGGNSASPAIDDKNNPTIDDNKQSSEEQGNGSVDCPVSSPNLELHLPEFPNDSSGGKPSDQI